MSFALLPLNTGDGSGGELIGDQFAQGGSTATVVFSGLCFGALGGGAYQSVDGAHGLPTQIVAALPAGTNVIGHVVVDSIGGTVTVDGTVAISGTVTVDGTVAATQSGTWQVEVTDGAGHTMPTGDTAARSIHTTIDNASVAVTGTFWQATQPVSGTVGVDSLPALASGSANVGYATPAVAGQTTGATPFHLGASAATVNATSVQAGACTLWDVIAMNVSTSAPAYLKLYDKASAPTVGTDTPVYVLPLPTAGSANGAGAARSWPTGLKFTLGLTYAITGGMADTDATAVAAGQVCLSGSYG